ncbi:MAG: hypothetical protein ACI4TH_05485 [Candidatus Ornithomonoglobus sp.]
MKKTTVLAALLLAVPAGTTAFAQTEYDPQEQSVHNSDQSSYQTVLITEGDGTEVTADKIVYAAQAAANNSFQAAANFLLKYNSDDGTSVKDGLYTIRFGGSSGRSTTATFAVGVGIEGYDTELTKLDAEKSGDNYNVSFTTSADGVVLESNAVILVETADGIMAYPVNNNITLSGGSRVILGVQINDVSDPQKVKVYLRQGASVETKQAE